MNNGDPNFNKVLVRLFGSDSSEVRRNVYIYLCIPFRAVLYLSILYLQVYRNIYVIAGILIISIFTAIRLYVDILNNNRYQWWSKKFQLVMSIGISITCVLALYQNKYGIIIPFALLFSLFGGILQYIKMIFF